MAASMARGVEWIALNDEPGITDAETIAGFISTMLLADLFDKTPEHVAEKVVKFRLEYPSLVRDNVSA